MSSFYFPKKIHFFWKIKNRNCTPFDKRNGNISTKTSQQKKIFFYSDFFSRIFGDRFDEENQMKKKQKLRKEEPRTNEQNKTTETFFRRLVFCFLFPTFMKWEKDKPKKSQKRKTKKKRKNWWGRSPSRHLLGSAGAARRNDPSRRRMEEKWKRRRERERERERERKRERSDKEKEIASLKQKGAGSGIAWLMRLFIVPTSTVKPSKTQ